MSDRELLKEVAHWVRYAKDDLKVAGLILEHGQVLRAACFNAQQCAEKSVKAALVFLQIPFPKTHNVQLLCELLPEGWTLGEDPACFSGLSDWAVEPRYPSDVREATREEAEATVEQAREAYEMTLEDLKSHGYDATAGRSEG